jgi:CelD/BcsL family acetyltransferase involved in cellulose biosynthesis
VAAGEDRRWAGIEAARPASLFLDRRWWGALADVYHLPVRAVLALGHDGRAVGALPYVELDDLRGPRIVSLPFCDFVDPPAPPGVWPALVEPLLGRRRPVVLNTPADHPATADARFTSTVDGVRHVVSVDPDPEVRLRGYGELNRRMVRRAGRAGIRYRFSTARGDLHRFHALHVGVRKYRHRLLAQPLALFDAIAERFFASGDGSGLVLGEVGGEVAGGCLVLRTPGAVHYKFSVSHPDHRRAGASHGAVHAALDHTAGLGVERFDLGRSDLAHTGLVDFKRRFGAGEVPLARHTAGPPVSPEGGALLGALTALLVDPAVPDQTTARAGALLYRYFA